MIFKDSVPINIYIYENTGKGLILKLIEYHKPMLHIRVCLHRTRQAAWLVRDMLQRNLLHGNSVYMVGSCHARLLHIIHVSAVSEVGAACAAWHLNFKINCYLGTPGLTAFAHLLQARASPCKRSCCISMFLFCGAFVVLQSRCLSRSV